MAAGSFTFDIAAVKSLNSFLTSPPSPKKVLPHIVRLPLSRMTCSSPLLATELPRKEIEDVLKMKLLFSSLSLSAEKSFDYGVVDSLGVDQIIRAPWDAWDTVQARRKEDVKQDGVALSAPLAWRDASLRYANVMWFKGSYNVEIICGENEPEESIVRRFRQAVSSAGVIRECQRRRYKESPQDTIKRKQRQASFNRKRKPMFNASTTQNAWMLSRENLKPVDHNKKKPKKKTSRNFSGQPRFDAKKKDGSDKKSNDLDDDYWGYVDEEGEEEASKKSLH